MKSILFSKFKKKNLQLLVSIFPIDTSIINLNQIHNKKILQCLSKLNLYEFIYENINVLKENMIQEYACSLLKLDNSIIAIATFSSIKIWNLTSKKIIKNLTGHGRIVTCLLKINSSKMASGSDDSSVKIWDTNTWFCLTSLSIPNPTCLIKFYLYNIAHLASGGKESIKIWNINCFTCLKTIVSKSPIHCMIQLNKFQIATGSKNKAIKIWDLSKRECVKTIIGHEFAVLVFEKLNENQLISGSEDASIKIWDIKRGKCVKTLYEHICSVTCLVKLNRIHLASLSRNSELKIWDLITGNCMKTIKFVIKLCIMSMIKLNKIELLCGCMNGILLASNIE